VARVNHLGLTVADMETSAGFYEDLGFSRLTAEPVKMDFDWTGQQVGHEGADLHILMIELEGAIVELVEYDFPEGGKRTPLETWDAGAAHVAVEVDDVLGEYERLRGKGVEFVNPPITIPDGAFEGCRCVYGRDPDGNIFELMSPLPAGLGA
jgi:catechol 2,3-dioxygenase-like lactoylglutathione lyase family enzyme